jgi:hypothetical protein
MIDGGMLPKPPIFALSRRLHRARNRKFESNALQRRVSDEPMSAVWRLVRRDLLALVVSDRPLSVLRQGLEDQPETLPQQGFGYSLARQIGKLA